MNAITALAGTGAGLKAEGLAGAEGRQEAARGQVPDFGTALIARMQATSGSLPRPALSRSSDVGSTRRAAGDSQHLAAAGARGKAQKKVAEEVAAASSPETPAVPVTSAVATPRALPPAPVATVAEATNNGPILDGLALIAPGGAAAAIGATGEATTPATITGADRHQSESASPEGSRAEIPGEPRSRATGSIAVGARPAGEEPGAVEIDVSSAPVQALAEIASALDVEASAVGASRSPFGTGAGRPLSATSLPVSVRAAVARTEPSGAGEASRPAETEEPGHVASWPAPSVESGKAASQPASGTSIVGQTGVKTGDAPGSVLPPTANLPAHSAAAPASRLPGEVPVPITNGGVEVASRLVTAPPASTDATAGAARKTAAAGAAAVGKGSVEGAGAVVVGRNQGESREASPAGIQAVAGPSEGPAGPRPSSAATLAVPPGEGIRQIDTGQAPPQILRTGPRSVEVGINDPVHGWVEVRAQGGSGQVHASLSASSSQVESALSAQLPGIAGYLAEREIGVHSLAVGREGSGEAGSLPTHSGGGPAGDGREFAGRGGERNTSSESGSGGFSERGRPPTEDPGIAEPANGLAAAGLGGIDWSVRQWGAGGGSAQVISVLA